MSELTRCNYCSLQEMRQLAKERGAKVILGRDEYGWITARYSDKKEPSRWFKELSERCVC